MPTIPTVVLLKHQIGLCDVNGSDLNLVRKMLLKAT